jgi:surfeit locus 1 family protein
MGNNDPFPGGELGRPVTISGTWVKGATLYVSQPGGGYWVISPIAVGGDASAPAIYVVRGSSPTTTSTEPSGPVTVVGWLEPDVSDMSLTDTNPSDDVLPQLQLSLAMPHVHQDLYGGYAVEADQQGGFSVATHNDATAGLRPVAEPAAPKADPTTGLRNLLYAFQWWLFGCFAIYVWWKHVREVTRPVEEQGADEPDVEHHAVPSGS